MYSSDNFYLNLSLSNRSLTSVNNEYSNNFFIKRLYNIFSGINPNTLSCRYLIIPNSYLEFFKL